MKKNLLKLLCAVACGAALVPGWAGAQIIEPDTIFYGQVINRTTAQLDLVTSGKLVWTIARPDGQLITVRTILTKLNNGLYSYRLSVPHEALTYGLTVDSSQVPLSASAATCTIVSIMVDTNPARIVSPALAVTEFPIGGKLSTV